MKQTVSVQAGPGFLGFLTLLFIALKLTGAITWPWLWVLSPLWLPIALLVLVCVVALGLITINWAWGELKRKWRRRNG